MENKRKRGGFGRVARDLLSRQLLGFCGRSPGVCDPTAAATVARSAAAPGFAGWFGKMVPAPPEPPAALALC